MAAHEVYAHLLEESQTLAGTSDLEHWFKHLKPTDFPADKSFKITRHDGEQLENYVMDNEEIKLITKKGKKDEFSVKNPSTTRFVIRENTISYDKNTRSFVMEFRNGGSEFNRATMKIIPKSEDHHKNVASDKAKKICKEYLDTFH